MKRYFQSLYLLYFLILGVNDGIVWERGESLHCPRRGNSHPGLCKIHQSFIGFKGMF
jgi:hypothetical protein